MIGDEQFLRTVAPIHYKEDRVGTVEITFALASTRAAIQNQLLLAGLLRLTVYLTSQRIIDPHTIWNHLPRYVKTTFILQHKKILTLACYSNPFI